ncbi:hypothetical protein E8E12_006907 [Didymella heteroderae]|uniref:Fungal N-terminal domain-containing protein n=1 Tax=Didymella heteroderae TaxID=1769908 RepID=A0A9P4WM93_9PLEO|nr:hypothetical protein E8E12_006907 [Didymella heteroderae]
MSGALEVAAGAFAVVGIADVLIRSGRELYNFLRDIEDAPANATKLRVMIEDSVLLADASKQYSLQLKAQHAPITDTSCALASALKAMDREVKSLKILTAKCKGNKKRWSSIRYALSEQRIDKALSNLERSKSTLATAFTLACRDLTSDDLQQIEKLVQQILSKDVDTSKLIAKLEANERSITTQLKVLKNGQDSRALEQRALRARLEAHHEAIRISQRSHEKSMAAIQKAQSSAASSHRQILSATTRTRRQTARMSRDMASHFQAANRQHQTTRDLIVATFRDVQNFTVKQVSVSPSSGREIVYQGKRQDLIVPTLYSIKIDLELVFDELYTRHSEDAHPHHVSWLQAELQNLLASAAQEEARLHPKSTATSFDAWIYPAKRKALDTGKTWALNAGETRTESVFMQHRRETIGSDATLSIVRHDQQSLWFRTRSGTFRIRMPRRKDVAQISDDTEEVAISLQPTASELPSVDARFLRLQGAGLAPRIYGQLNIFLPVERTVVFRDYYGVIKYGSIPDLDRALRTGTICPYRNWEFGGELTGINPLFFTFFTIWIPKALDLRRSV